MTMTVEEYILGRVPSIDSQRVQALLPLSLEDIGEQWGECREKAQALLILHWISLENQAGGSSEEPGSILPGLISVMKEGDLSIDRENPSSSEGGFRTSELPWSGTIYGQELIQLKRGCFLTPRNRMV